MSNSVTEFIAAIKGSPTAKVSFQVFDDTKEKDETKACKFDGTLFEHIDALQNLNRDRRGVFLFINELDGKGHYIENVVGLKAVFVDSDNGPLKIKLPVKPNIVTHSKNGPHYYWLLKPVESIELFYPFQRALAEKLGTDKKVSNLNRVMRLPGFQHHKEDPFDVTCNILDETTKYTIKELAEAFELDLEQYKNPIKLNSIPIDIENVPIKDRLDRFKAYLSEIPGAIEGKGGDHHTYAVCALAGDFGLNPDDAFPALMQWNKEKCIPPWTEEGLMTKLNNAYKYRNGEVGEKLSSVGTTTAQKEPTKSYILEDLWKPLDRGLLDTTPPERQYLLKTRLKENRRGVDEPVGFLPMGRVGMLAAGGGVGKSWALTQLAVSVASGRDWLGYTVEHAGLVLLALAEEDMATVHERLHYAAEQMNLEENEKRLVESRIVALPLSGKTVSLTYSNNDLRLMAGNNKTNSIQNRESPFFEEFKNRLKKVEKSEAFKIGWSLLILDPVSRFCNADTEIDNFAATQFIQCLERLTKVPGNPLVLVAHHTNKSSRNNGKSDQTAARGSSGLTDGVRVQLNLENLKRVDSDNLPDMAVLRAVKNNYGWSPPSITLCKDREFNGALRKATKQEIFDYEEAAKQKDDSSPKTMVHKPSKKSKEVEQFDNHIDQIIDG